MKNFKAQIISAFPGTGKSYIYNNKLFKDKKVLDSDSSEFSWIIHNGKKVRNPQFPINYLHHIITNLEKVDYIFVSTHQEVRDILINAKIPFTLVVPDITLKSQYLERYRQRGSPEKFVETLDMFWDKFINDCLKDKNCDGVDLRVLQSGQYLQDILN